MPRLPYKTPEAERIFQSNNVDNRMASANSTMPDDVLNQMQEQMMAKLSNPDGAPISPKTLSKATA